MSVEKDASVRVGIEGAEDVGAGAAQAFAPWERAGAKVMSGLERIGASAGQAMAGVATDLVRVGTALGAVDLAGLAGRYRTFTEDVARMGVATGKNLDDLKKKFADLADTTGIKDERLASIAQGMQRATYTDPSRKTMEAITGEALSTGKTPEEQAQFAVTLQNTFGVAADQTAEAMGRIRAAAEKAGVAPGRLQDQFASLGGTLNRVSIKGVDDVGRLASTVASIGKGMRPDQQAQAQQRVLSFLTSNPEQLRHELGMKQKDFYDENGDIKDFGNVARRYRDKFVKQVGGRQNAIAIASQDQNLGALGARAFFGADFGAEGEEASEKALQAQRKFLGTDVGKQITKRNLRDAHDRETGGKDINDAQQWFRDLMPDNPLARYALGAVGGSLGASGVKALFTAGRAAVGAGEGAGGGSSLAGRFVMGGLRLAGGGSAGIGAAAVATSLAYTAAMFKVMGLDKFNDAMPQIRGETEDQLGGQRAGRARALIRTIATYGDQGPGAVLGQLGPKLAGEVGRDPALQAVAQAATSRQISEDALANLPEDLRRAVEDGFRNLKIEVTNSTGLDGITAEPKRQ
jgi:hypothetical protein